MPEPRSNASSRREPPARQTPEWRTWIEPLKPDLSGRGGMRLAGRVTIAAVVIAIMTALADWSARGFLDRGGLDRLVSMKPAAQVETRTALKPDRVLDRGRLKAILAADKPR